ncbi:MAG: helix-hairpin-helix domain-containing protein [Gemmatimonadetes bacterium]|nr:helix-hairpin-helix domain-containing protein [Gemmatimonadota bacterium]
MTARLRRLLSLLTPSERGLAAFLVGWALVGALASALPWTASFRSDGRKHVLLPANDTRAALHAKSLALARHLELARTPPPSPLDPNLATPAELDRLPGVGPATALRWGRVRLSDGPFIALEDLRRVRGLGPKRLAKLAPHLRFRPPAARRARTALDGMDLNLAKETDLLELPGVGPVLARRIVARRLQIGRFRSSSDLDSVPGVGPALLAKLSARVRFE